MEGDHFDKLELFEELYPNPNSSKVGAHCIDRSTKDKKVKAYNSLYGELILAGLSTFMHFLSNECNSSHQVLEQRFTSLSDLGCGIGKLPVLCLLFFPNFKRLYGIELFRERFEIGRLVILTLYQKIKREGVTLLSTHNQVTLTIDDRSLTIQCGDIYELANSSCDVYIADFAFRDESDTQRFVDFMIGTQPGAVFLTYESISGKDPRLSSDFRVLGVPPLETTWSHNATFQSFMRIEGKKKRKGVHLYNPISKSFRWKSRLRARHLNKMGLSGCK